ncbi:RagB/SusD family nutrient uptake outer membrane protein [Tamlana sp. 62-3]|uniref:RagB/SusD family nutrient uptake outer membrane protein n=1 Tax=Neotamlana sargassicola TaxID=2883125 RepID=A0A9X1I679_9FLAO|nr:RagB/SusD family nutrient uptake outer membrane protein [Tamlana sargassicola]MCB4808208.1 RagB/SusD family nutrient uptake outer membrane protein [Tamlana sargassicola]
MKNKLILIIILSVLSYSCDDALDVQPENYLFEDQLVTDDKSAQTSLFGVYTQLNWIYGQNLELSFPFLDGSLTTTNATFIFGQAASNVISPEDGTLNTFYEWPYYIINSANATIEAVTNNAGVSQTEQDRILGEAYFMRAFGHYIALRSFGQFFDLSSSYGIVLRDVVSTVENSQKQRSTVQECYDFILDDLDMSIQKNTTFSNNYYASSLAAKSFKANVLLYMGGTENYTEAITLADEVINSGDVSLEPNFEDIFINGEANSEVIFCRVVGEGQSNKFSYYYQTLPRTSTWLQNYLENDPREEDSYDTSNLRLKKIFTTEISGGPTNYLRLAEVYLIKAECQARLNLLDDAENTLNVIRNRAYGGSAPELTYTNQQELLDLIFDEYVKELCFESGAVWFAAIRHEKIETLKDAVTSSDQYILPIPMAELQTNLEFGSQNPGYLDF